MACSLKLNKREANNPILEKIILSINKLTKHYGHVKAVQSLELDIHKGDVYGILGPNGSGKSTTLGMLLDVVNPTSGGYTWFGQKPTHESRKKIGSILEHPLFYPYLTAIRNLRLVAAIKQTSFEEIDDILKQVGLFERRHSKFKTFSYGMRQRLALAAALLGNPEVLILDEPTNGLDPQGIAEIRELITKVASQGITIILASHLLDEVQKTCSHVAVLEKGKKLFSGNVSEVLNETVQIEVSSADLETLKTAINTIEFAKSQKQEGDILLVRLDAKNTGLDLNKCLVEKGIILNHLSQRKKTLEKYFLELLENS